MMKVKGFGKDGVNQSSSRLARPYGQPNVGQLSTIRKCSTRFRWAKSSMGKMDKSKPPRCSQRWFEGQRSVPSGTAGTGMQGQASPAWMPRIESVFLEQKSVSMSAS